MSTPARITTVLLLVVGAFVAGNLTRRPAAPASATSSRPVLHWACPMHPQYKSNRSGDCPSCGMRLEAVYGGEASTADAGLSGVPGLVQVSAAKQQLIGVRTDIVQRASNTNALRVPGRIAVDDSRQYRLVAAADGWIRELQSNPAGTFVKKDEVLASYYVQNLVSTQQSYLYAFDINSQYEQAPTNNALQRNTASLNLRTALDALRSLGMADLQVEELRRTHNPASEMRLYSPVTGFVLARNISPGQRFDKGSELYRIGDISQVWVITDIFEKDREFLLPGAMAMVRYRGRDLPARMSDALPQFDPQSRTLKTRFELDNAGFVLRPDMFVDVEVRVNMPAAITIPADAVIDSGRRKTVYVNRGSGFFEPRLVKTGWRLGDRVQVTAGLELGERIVISGNFLIDSESRMKLAAASVAETSAILTERDPVCGMDVDPKALQSVQLQHAGRRYTFCSEKCKREFEATIGKSVAKQQPAPASGARGTE